jgi:hypothetical protein
MKKPLRIFLTILAALTAFYFLPLYVVDVTDSQGNVWKAPVLSWFAGSDETGVTFQSVRSAYALNKDGINAEHYHTEETCRGVTYYYDEENDVSYYGTTTETGLLNSVTLQYQSGDACEGWGTNDEVAWEFGDIADVDWNVSQQEAEENEWFVLADGEPVNIGVFHDFSNMVKQGVYCYLRTVIYEDGKVSSIVDIQMMEVILEGTDTDAEMAGVQANTGNAFRVWVRTSEGVTQQDYVRYSDTVGEDGYKPVTVYASNATDDTGVVLFRVYDPS